MKFIALILAVLYAVSPYDLFPDFIFGWGWIDDLIVVGLLWWYFSSYRKARHGSQRYFHGRAQTSNEETQGFSDAGPNYRGQGAAKDPYAVLEVDKHASPEEIKRAYRRLASKYHPDKVSHMGDDFRELAEKRFKEIQSAYQELVPK